jgi:hypothetical protein
VVFPKIELKSGNVAKKLKKSDKNLGWLRKGCFITQIFTILKYTKKHWNEFTIALGDLKTREVWLSDLEKLRDPDAHRRDYYHIKNILLWVFLVRLEQD